ncbi:MULTISPECIES: Crp/Fnr family transcriptional regulator [unclassified Novosphingobium]|uniref:Crp/Fnr family transcriptional regulator n=1 Tax=unclassified Novosphingobium TaxID=2644732 RepID=UPI0013587056|nr:MULTISPECIES: Crp/Fnr family transcriptional regulator [unclassified Novosphingobium]
MRSLSLVHSSHPFETSPIHSLEGSAVVRHASRLCGLSANEPSQTNWRTREVEAGAFLVGEGESSASLYFLQAGWACRFATTRGGKRQIAAIMLPGDACNLDALAFDRIGNGVQMLTSGRILAIPLPEAREMRACNPQMALAFSWLAFLEISIMAQWTMRRGLPARDRLLHFMCEASHRLDHGADAELRGNRSLEVPMTQEWLADVLGLTNVHVNRTVVQLRSEGVLASNTRRIVVPDVDVLRRSVAFDPAYLHPKEARATSFRSVFS